MSCPDGPLLRSLDHDSILLEGMGRSDQLSNAQTGQGYERPVLVVRTTI
jgi:hypothetical protein